MSKSDTFNWYQLSKLNENKPNIESFLNLIKNAHMGQQISNVPISLRQKLLVAFQNVSGEIKRRYYQQKDIVEQLQYKKIAAQQTLNGMKQQLDFSLAKLKSDGILIEEKKRVLQKLKQKVKKKQQKKEKSVPVSQVYFCPLCTRQDFKSRSQFSFHMAKQHSAAFNQDQNKSQAQSQSQQSIPAEVKDLLISLKDKQIQLMQMMLNKKKQIQTMELQKAYSLQLQKIKTQSNFVQRKSQYLNQQRKLRTAQQINYNEQQQQLKGQSQYLFYPQQNQRRSQPHIQQIHDPALYQQFYQDQQRYSEYMHPHVHPNDRFASHVSAQKPQILPQPQRPDYYNIFNGEDIAQSVDHSFSPDKIAHYNQIKRKKLHTQHIQSQQIPTPKTPTPLIYTQTSINRNLIFQKTPINRPNQTSIQSKIYNYTQNADHIDKSMASSSESRKYGTVFDESKRNIQKLNDGHIFNSGPLMDDVGDGSDYEDYFGGRGIGIGGSRQIQTEDQVVDEEIVVRKPQVPAHPPKNILSPKSNRPELILPYQSRRAPSEQASKKIPRQSSNQQNHSINTSNVLLEYSKDKSFLEISRSKDEISHSQSNIKDKSSELIQLSNSFSKRALDSSKNDESSINLSDLKLSKLERQKQLKKQQKKEEPEQVLQMYKRPQFLYTNNNQKSYESNPAILQQFHREPSPLQLNFKKVNNQKPEKSQNSQPKIKMPEQLDLLKTNSKVLEQFFYKPNYS